VELRIGEWVKRDCHIQIDSSRRKQDNTPDCHQFEVVRHIILHGGMHSSSPIHTVTCREVEYPETIDHGILLRSPGSNRGVNLSIRIRLWRNGSLRYVDDLRCAKLSLMVCITNEHRRYHWQVQGSLACLKEAYLTNVTSSTGDTIPHVLASLLPQPVRETALGAMLVNRQFIIALAIGGVAYPLSLYRDISKLAKASSLGTSSLNMPLPVALLNISF
jgi:hypothetical protein